MRSVFMADEQVRVTFEPNGRVVQVLRGTKLLEAAAKAGFTLDTPCGGAGSCGKCRVQATACAPEPTATERAALSAGELAAGWRLACQSPAVDGAVVKIPPDSLFADQHQILTAARAAARQDILPAVRKEYVELSEPTLADSAADLQRLQAKIGPVRADLAVLRELADKLRAGRFRGTAVMTDHRLIDFEPGDTREACYGAAFDIGTTTLVGALLNLGTGEELAVASALNPQVSFGDDVVSRIERASSCPSCLRELQEVVCSAVGEMLARMCAQAGVRTQNVYELAFSGNTTMQQLLCGIDVRRLGELPFVPVSTRAMLLSAAELRIPVHPRAAAYVFASIGGFVGGDTVAGTLATRLAEQPSPSLLVDIGTNGEIVLAHEGKLFAASTAAGPAFEGARISCGMRAAGGAVEKVVFSDAGVQCGVIGAVPPTGLCGSGLVDAAAELLRAGILESTGRLLGPADLPQSLSAELRRRVRLDDAGSAQFLVSDAGPSPVRLTQRDIRELQLSAGAIRAGIRILLRQRGLKTSDLQTVFIAGGFGNFIRRSNAQRIGLLPGDIPHERIHSVGNASLSGARWALLSTAARTRSEQLAAATRHVELSQDLQFQAEFAESMIFPED
jgi:uncharacterized 2Fe-2S/4Fe-4S cluster protein (DUF4445 family)